MSCVVPVDVEGVVAALASDPTAVLLGGGTDLMVEVKFKKRPIASIVALGQVGELHRWSHDGDTLRIGSAVPFSTLEREPFTTLAPCLAQAARTVGSPQIRNAATLGGNLATASPAGDTLPPLVALDAVVELAGPDGRRRLPVADFVTGPKRTAIRPGEVIVAVDVPVVAGCQEYLKVGTRNAMVISVAGLALVASERARTVRVALGSVGPVPLRAQAAETWIATRLDWDDHSVGADDVTRFGEMVAAESAPIDDHRSTAAYRRHAVEVCARRALRRAFPGTGAPSGAMS